LSGNRFRARFRTEGARPLVLAHRGDSYHAPENTLEAARLGLDSGADGWELDVRLTADRVPVLLHDESLLRTTDVARRFEGDPRAGGGFLLGEFTFEEVRTLDAGSWFVDPSGGPRSANGFGTLDRLPEFDRGLFASGKVRIPTLAEALGLTLRLDKLVNVEIKPTAGDPVALLEAVLLEVMASGTQDRVSVSSFDHDIVRRSALLEPGVATGALVLGPLDQPPGELLESLGADALHAPADGLDRTRLEVPTLAFTVNETGPGGLALRLVELGVSGLFTDNPVSLAARLGITPSSRRTRSRSGRAGRRSGDPSGGPTPPPSR
jgi:glycerophosphoryl diester phosphodiesterase